MIADEGYRHHSFIVRKPQLNRTGCHSAVLLSAEQTFGRSFTGPLGPTCLSCVFALDQNGSVVHDSPTELAARCNQAAKFGNLQLADRSQCLRALLTAPMSYLRAKPCNF